MEEFWIALIIIAVLVGFSLIIKLYLKLSAGWDTSATCLMGKTALITGANSGIGFYTAQDFAKRGARVILACRDRSRAEQAKTKIIEATGNSNVVVRIVDLISLASVRQFAEEIAATEERLDILVNNAGAGGFEYSITEDRLSKSMQINYFSSFLLIRLLTDLLKKSSPSRVVTVISDIADLGRLNLDDLNAFPRGMMAGMLDYANANLCRILFSNEFARRMQGTGVTANSVHPGAVKTTFIKEFPTIPRIILSILGKLFFKTPEEGAQSSIYVSVSRDVEDISGAYFADCKHFRTPKSAQNDELARKLWKKSEELVKLTPEGKIL